jgi:hypothetical protein
MENKRETRMKKKILEKTHRRETQQFMQFVGSSLVDIETFNQEAETNQNSSESKTG